MNNWSEQLESLQVSVNRPFHYIKIERLDFETNYQILRQYSRLQFIDELFHLFVTNICINDIRKNIGLKYEIIRNTEEWCYTHIIKMKMIEMKYLRDGTLQFLVTQINIYQQIIVKYLY